MITRETHPAVLVNGASQTLEYRYAYDANGNLTSMKVLSNNTAVNTEWKWTYDSKFSQLLSAIDEIVSATDDQTRISRVTSYELDSRGNTTKIREPSIKTTLPVVTELAYFTGSSAKRGLLQKQTSPDPDGSGPLLPAITEFDYDARGNLNKLTEQGPNGALVTTFRYFAGTDRLQDVTDPNGNISLALSNYTPMGLATTRTEAVGSSDEAKTVSRYDARGNVVELTLPDPDGTGPLTSSVYAYHYDHHGQLAEVIAPAVSVVQPDGSTATVSPTTHYEYDYRMLLTSITDPLGAVTSFKYDARGRLREQWLPDPDGVAGPLQPTHHLFEYDARDRTISHVIEDPDHAGQKLFHETYQHDPLGRIARVYDELRDASTSYEYDLSGNVRFVTDAESRKTEYKYDTLGRLIETMQPHPSSTSTSASGPVWKQSYDAQNRVTSRTDPRDNTTTYAYDRLSRLQKVTLPDPDGPTSGSRGTLPAPSIEYAYSKLGEIDSETDHLGRKTEYDYDRMSRLTTVKSPDPDGPTSGSSGTLTALTTTTRYDRLGRVVEFVDQRGQTTSYAYNKLSWLESVTSPDPDGAGSLMPLTTSMTYDANGALRRQTAPGPNGSPLTTTYERDALSRVTTVTVPAPGGSSASEVSRVRYGYDGLGRTVSVTDPLNHVTQYAFDPLRRQTRITEPDPDGSGNRESAAVTTLTYDKVGNLTELQDAAGNKTRYVYDRLDRLAREIELVNPNPDSPANKKRVFNYDDVGNLTKRTDRNGRVTEWDYDNLNRPTVETWVSSDPNTKLKWSYDAAGNLQSAAQEVTTLRVADVNLEFSYDQLDRLTSVQDMVKTYEPGVSGPKRRGVRLNYAYNSVGDLRQTAMTLKIEVGMTLVKDFVNDYQYDNLGRMTQVVQSGKAASGDPPITRKRVNLVYSAGGWLSQVIRSTGAANAETEAVTSRYSYFDNGGLREIANTHSGATLSALGVGLPALGGSLSTPPTTSPPPATPISAYSWTYDVAGRVASFTNSLSIGPLTAQGTKTVNYGYDDTDQLTNVTPVGAPSSSGLPTESFDYDTTGNRDSQTTNGSGTVNKVERNRLLDDGKFVYGYDAEGNLTSKATIINTAPNGTRITGSKQLFSYDYRNRLTNVEFRDASNRLTKSVVLTYDPFDRRVLKQVSANGDDDFTDATDRIERYVYDGDHVALVLKSNYDIERRFLHGPAIDQVFAEEVAGTSSNSLLNWQLTDNQNTVRDVVNKTGTQLVNHLDYSGFGRITSETDAAATPFFSYTGREYDEDINLIHYRRRDVDPDTNRFTTNDPLGLAAGDVNFQRYVGNSPTNATDPSGLDPEYGTQEWFIWLATKDNSYDWLFNYRKWLAEDYRLRNEGTQIYLNFIDRAASDGVDLTSIDARIRLFQKIRRENAAKSTSSSSICAEAGSSERSRGAQREWETNQIAHGHGPIMRAATNFFVPADRNPNSVNLDIVALSFSTAYASRRFIQSPQLTGLVNSVSGPRTTGAESVAQSAKLKEYYSQAEVYGAGGVKQLENGRYRFYSPLKPADHVGEMAGRHLVREWDPATGAKRSWHETLDHAGRVRIVRPEPRLPQGHFLFDAEGNYVGTRP